MDKPNAGRRDALLVGSIPLADAEAVFRTTSRILGSDVRQLPDGETRQRSNWINWQLNVMRSASFLVQRSSSDGYGAVMVDIFVPREPDSDPARWEFGPLGYSRAAAQSYPIFARLKSEGVIARDVKFQVSLPTPLAPMTSFIAPEHYRAVEPAYERRMREEIAGILSVVPPRELALQWDTAVEFALLEGVFPGALAKRTEEIMERLVRLTSWVPSSVDLGFHFCYGDAGHRHFKEPVDSGLLVQVANALTSSAIRPLQWLHLPVPRDRADSGYFAPMRDLRLSADTRLYLGLLHFSDGVTGATHRLHAAEEFVGEFGIATECGFGRRPADQVVPLLQLHVDVLRRLDAPAPPGARHGRTGN